VVLILIGLVWPYLSRLGLGPPAGRHRHRGTPRHGADRGKYLRPAWSPPAEVKRDNPSLPRVIPGGSPRNPMGAAASGALNATLQATAKKLDRENDVYFSSSPLTARMTVLQSWRGG